MSDSVVRTDAGTVVHPEHRVVVAMPTDRDTPFWTLDSFAGVYGHGLLDGVVTAKLIMGDTYIDMARNALVEAAMKLPTDPTHILWFDSDMTMPPDTVKRLLAHDKDVVGGLYQRRQPAFGPVAYDYADDGPEALWIELPDDPHGLVRVGGMGLGCCLVRIGVYTEIRKRLSMAWWHQVSYGRGEDLHFFDLCRQLDIEAWLDCDLRAGHIRREVVGNLHYEAYRRATEAEGHASQEDA